MDPVYAVSVQPPTIAPTFGCPGLDSHCFLVTTIATASSNHLVTYGARPLSHSSFQSPTSRLCTCSRNRSHTGGARLQIGCSEHDPAVASPSLSCLKLSATSPAASKLIELGAERARRSSCCSSLQHIICIGSDVLCVRLSGCCMSEWRSTCRSCWAQGGEGET